MTTPEQTPDTELEVQELTDEKLEGVSGGAAILASEWTGILTNNPAGRILVADGKPHPADTLLD
jgi:hypothetical protein